MQLIKPKTPGKDEAQHNHAVPALPDGRGEVSSVLLEENAIAFSVKDIENFVRTTAIQALDEHPNSGEPIDGLPFGIVATLVALLLRDIARRIIKRVKG